jgi:hypothetical protein
MFRFTIRDVIWLTVVIAIGIAFMLERSARVNDRIAVVRSATDDEREALNSRFVAAKAECHQRMTSWRAHRSGRMSVDEICETIERYAEAAEEAPEPADVRVKELRHALEAARVIAENTKEKYEADVELVTTLHRTQYTCADVEARLKRVEAELAAARR